jgi:hypothetical protein
MRGAPYGEVSMVRRIVALGTLLFATHIAAEGAELNGDALRELVAGAVVEIDTPLDVKVPIRYSHEGRVTGEAPSSLAYILGAPTDIGRWWVAADRLCHRWTRWFDGAVQCLRISQDGSRISWRRDDGESGTATITTRQVNAARAANKVEEPAARATPEPERLASATPSVATMLPSLPLLIPPAQAAIAAPPSTSAQPRPNDSPVAAPSKPATNGTAKVSAMVARAAPAGRPTQGAAAPSLAALPSEASGARQQELFRVVGVTIDDVLNVREGPSADHTIVGTILPEATGLRLTGPCLSVWCPISHRGTTGWVNSMYLTKDTRAGTSQRNR